MKTEKTENVRQSEGKRQWAKIGLLVLAGGIVVGSAAGGKIREAKEQGGGHSEIEKEKPITLAPVFVSREEVIAASKDFLAQEVKIGVDKLELVSAVEVEWPNSCLGVSKEGIFCFQVITPGYRLIYREENGNIHEVHTDKNGESKIYVQQNF